MHTPVKENIATNNNKGGSFFPPAVIQPKLTVNEPGDMYEQEADAMADKVMRMSDKQRRPFFFPPAPGNSANSGIVQRACGVTDIGPTPPDCRLAPRDPLGIHFLFDINCDEFAPGQEAALVSFASTISPNEGIDILGVASQEGPADFNVSLSCKRAAAVKNVLIRSGIPASRIGRVEAAGPRGRAGDANMRAGVIDLVSIMSETMPPSPGLATRTTIGVGEDVLLTHTSGNNSTAWTASAGTLLPPIGAMVQFKAPDTAQTVTITAGGASIRFNVLAPTNVFMERMPGTNIKHFHNLPSCGLVLDVYLQPDNVNFHNVIFRELDVVGVPFPAGGAYSCNPFRGGHCVPAGLSPCGDKRVTQTVVAGKGSKSDEGDCAYSGHCFGAPPFTPGSVFLVIPYEYKVGTGSFHHFTNVLQMHTLLGDANTILTSKANASGSTTVTAPQSLTPECP
jgi:outer membrane protein OmpA-like peptidoglycan-associated protein